jgi:hypothetical protein
VADAVAAEVVVQVVIGGDGVRVAEVLDDLQRVSERQHLDARDRLDVVGEMLQVTFVVQGRGERVRVGVLGAQDLSTRRLDAGLGLAPAAPDVGGAGDVVEVGGVGELDPEDQVVGGSPVEGDAGRVGPAMLHRLKHARDVTADPVCPVAVAVDDPCDSAHGVSCF